MLLKKFPLMTGAAQPPWRSRREESAWVRGGLEWSRMPESCKRVDVPADRFAIEAELTGDRRDRQSLSM
jgi:hypothetical protein